MASYGASSWVRFFQPNGWKHDRRVGLGDTRSGIHALVELYALKLETELASVAKKGLSPYTIRHTTVRHLLRAGVDINTIRDW